MAWWDCSNHSHLQLDLSEWIQQRTWRSQEAWISPSKFLLTKVYLLWNNFLKTVGKQTLPTEYFNGWLESSLISHKSLKLKTQLLHILHQITLRLSSNMINDSDEAATDSAPCPSCLVLKPYFVFVISIVTVLIEAAVNHLSTVFPVVIVVSLSLWHEALTVPTEIMLNHDLTLILVPDLSPPTTQFYTLINPISSAACIICSPCFV